MTPRPDAYPHGLSRTRAHLALTVLSLTAFVFVTSEILPIGLIAMMAKDLGRPESQIGLIVTVHSGVVVAVSIAVAQATRHLPRRVLLPGVLGVFVLGTLVVATAESFTQLIVGRAITGVGHATFWAVVTATAASLFPPDVRGRTVARLLVGPSVAGIVGLPVATWLAQRTSWTVPFLVVAALAAVMAIAILVIVPHYSPKDGGAARGSAPSRRRFVALLGIVLMTVIGANVTFTFITPYLRDVTGFSEEGIPLVLVAGGIAGLVGMLAASRVLDRYPRGTMAFGLVLVLVGWFGLLVAGSGKPLALVVYCLLGLGSSVAVGAWASRVLIVSPGNTDLSVAIYGTTYNAGIAIGSLVGSEVFDVAGARILPAITAGCVVVALAILATEPEWKGRLWIRRRVRVVEGHPVVK